jgi:Mrp family chromosome partitioning ATPase
LVLGLASGWSGPQPSAATYYSATSTLVLRPGAGSLGRVATFVTDGEVPRRVAASIGGTAASVASLIQVTTRPEAGLLQITAFDVDGAGAAQKANVFTDELIRFERELAEQQRAAVVAPLEARYQSLLKNYTTDQQAADAQATEDAQAASDGRHLQLTATASQLAALATQIRAVNSQAAIDSGLTAAHVAEPVVVNSQTIADLFISRYAQPGKTPLPSAIEKLQRPPVEPLGTPVGRGVAGAAAGLLFGLVLTTVIERVDPRIRWRLDAERAFGWPVVAEVPSLNRRQRHRSRVMALDRPRSKAADAYRRLRGALLQPKIVRGGRVIMVTSPGPGEGKTTSVANLAVVLGETGLSVLVVDCDFRRPRVRAYLGRDDETLADPDNDRLRHVAFTTLEAGEMDTANPVDVVAAQRQLINEARSSYDVILLDTAPLLTTNDAVELLDLADQVVLLGRVGRTTKEAADLAGELLERRQAPPVTAALVGVTRATRSRVFGPGRRRTTGRTIVTTEPAVDLVGSADGASDQKVTVGAASSDGLGEPGESGSAHRRDVLVPTGRRLAGTHVVQESSGSLFGLLATVLGVVVVVLLFSKFTDAYQPTVGAVVMLPVVIGVGAIMIRRVQNSGVRDIRSIMILGLMMRLIGGYYRFTLPADARTYHDEGVRLAASFRSFNFNVDIGRDVIGTGFIRYLSGLVHVVVADDMSAAFFVWVIFSFAGCVLLYQAFVLAVPGGDRYRYALVLFCWPSLAYWPDSIGKEGWMLLGIGLVSYGAARVFTKHRTSGLVLLALGLAASALVRPHVALAMFLAMSVALLIRRSKVHGVGMVFKALGVVLLLVVGGFLANKTASVLSHDEALDTSSSSTLDSTSSALDTATDRTSQGDSAFQATTIHGPLDVPKAFVTVLFRPFPWEAHDINGLLTAGESIVLVVLLAMSHKRLRRLPTLMREVPYVSYVVVYTAVFVYAFAAIGNFGILARQRTQLTPLLLVLVALPEVSDRMRRRVGTGSDVVAPATDDDEGNVLTDGPVVDDSSSAKPPATSGSAIGRS